MDRAMRSLLALLIAGVLLAATVSIHSIFSSTDCFENLPGRIVDRKAMIEALE